MTTISRVRTTWSGFAGAPGYTAMWCTSGAEQTLMDAQRAFFNSIKALFCTPVGFAWSPGDITVDVATGAVNGFYGGKTPPAGVSGTAGTLAYAAGVGVRVAWTTSTLRGSRRMQGSSILVPVAPGAFATDGTIDNANLATIQTAANTLVSTMGTNLLVFGRPTVLPRVQVGTTAIVNGAIVRDYATLRRSRRD